MSTLERLGSLDMTWLQIERSTNLMQVVGVLVLATPLDHTALVDRLCARLLPMERFRQLVLHDTAGAIWESAPVDLNAHITLLDLPPGDEEAGLRALIGQLAATPLDPARPLWHLHLVAHYRGGSAVIVRVHQCIADSIALIHVLQSLTDASPTAEAPPPAEAPTLFDLLYAPLTDAVIDSIKLSGAIWARYLSLLFNPAQVFDYARASTALALEIGKLAGLHDDNHTFLKGEPKGIKHVSWSAPLAESTIATIARAREITPDAVLLAALSGALHDHLSTHDEQTSGVELRTLMPVNLRVEGAEDVLGNRWGFMPLELPVGMADALDRLAEMDRRVTRFAKNYDAQRALGIFSLIGQTPRAVQLQALKLLATKSTALLCHVPGAREPRYLAGARIVEQMFWSPPSGDLGLAISIVNYDGHYRIGLLADTAMVPAPEAITDRIPAQLDAIGTKAPRRRKQPA